MSTKKSVRRSFTFVLLLAMIIALEPYGVQPSFAAYSPPVSTLRIGLYFDSAALPSANLQNVSGLGSGFEFGYYDANRQFVPIDAWTDESAITMMMDKNMSWYPNDAGGFSEYREGTDGSFTVGCYHLMIDAYYESFEQALATAELYEDSYVKYDSGRFYVMIGQFLTRAEADDAFISRGLSGCLINSGTSDTIAVVRTGTSKMVFEFDYGSSRFLAVRPKQIDEETPETWFRGYKYNGGFQYARRSGMLLTVVNYVDIEDYVKGILPYEMSNSWPIEALKAQACCARTYALSSLNTHSAHGVDLCVTEHCQVYRGRGSANELTDRAVDETASMYVTYNGDLCTTYYASSNGGASESCENVWNESIPYLRGVIDPYEADVASRIPNYNWTVRYTQDEITQRMRNRGYNCATIVKMAVSAYTPTGNVLSVTLTDANGATYVLSKRERITTTLGVPTQRFNIGNSVYAPAGIFVNMPMQRIDADTQMFAVGSDSVVLAVSGMPVFAINASGSIEAVSGEFIADAGDNGMINGSFVINGSGNGHNVGMSQWGAYSMAEYHGMSFIDIIKFYYTGVDVG
ncbi:MAG: SpoIID/LytB domain-containing protein [Oscillospiraceae bacterium]|nr:SpoIID/LytB domain-containing protein [Oscillospiraceae bacterium]